jgi:hypothetical protein
MISNGLIPNVFTYSALVRAGVRGGKSGAQRVSFFILFLIFHLSFAFLSLRSLSIIVLTQLILLLN